MFLGGCLGHPVLALESILLCPFAFEQRLCIGEHSIRIAQLGRGPEPADGVVGRPRDSPVFLVNPAELQRGHRVIGVGCLTKVRSGFDMIFGNAFAQIVDLTQHPP